MDLEDAKPGVKVANRGYGYYGTVVRTERKFRTDWVVVLWEGTIYTVREYPESLDLCHERPARVTPYN